MVYDIIERRIAEDTKYSLALQGMSMYNTVAILTEVTELKILRKVMIMPALLLAGLMILKMPEVQAAQGVDYSELEYQIGYANGLESYDYTAETWEVLQNAVEAGNKRLAGAVGQSELDGAAEDIKLAIENLEKMDYSALDNALDYIYKKIDENPAKHDVWYRLDKAVDKARPLLVSGNQVAVDEMAQTLDSLIEELMIYEELIVDPDVIIQEVEVEVPPEADYCNIPMHRIWMTLFVVSAAVNVLLLAILGYVVVKKRSAVEHTPLVNLDMDEDIYSDIDEDIYGSVEEDFGVDINTETTEE